HPILVPNEEILRCALEGCVFYLSLPELLSRYQTRLASPDFDFLCALATLRLCVTSYPPQYPPSPSCFAI
ncbi:MAG: hypothetical protein ACPGWR_31230, partial [Ardenticatenaceae bacterium]